MDFFGGQSSYILSTTAGIKKPENFQADTFHLKDLANFSFKLIS